LVELPWNFLKITERVCVSIPNNLAELRKIIIIIINQLRSYLAPIAGP
jgi:hypothetical protein